MRKIAWLFIISLLLCGCAHGGSLLVNGGAEEGSTVAWTATPDGFVVVDAPVGYASPGPVEGQRYFHAGQAARATMAQEAPLPANSAGKLAALRAGLFGGPAGLIMAELEALGPDGTALDACTTGPIADERWTDAQLRLMLPPAAAKLRVRLTSLRRSSGRNTAFADDIRLTVEDPPPPPAKPAILLGPTLTVPSDGSVYVWWRLNTELHEHRVEFGSTEALGEAAKLARWTQFPYVKLQGLEPGRRYFYRVASGALASDTFCFRTPAAERLRMVIWGDNQGGVDEFTKLTLPTINQLKPDVLLSAGDVVDDGRRPEDWPQQLYGPAAGLLRTTPWFPVRGNHDGDWGLSWQMLPFPDNPHFYARTLGPVRVVALDGNLDYGPGSDELKWLQQEVSGAGWKRAKLRLVSVHQAPFVSLWDSPAYDGEALGRSVLVELLEKSGADLVICGHAHCYERGSRPRPDGRKTHYLVSGGGGGALDTVRVFPWPHITRSLSVHHVVVADISFTQAHIQAIDSTTQEKIDELDIECGPLQQD
jgi:3',5'-cyclic AMP phosphodiesterase CpdA